MFDTVYVDVRNSKFRLGGLGSSLGLITCNLYWTKWQ